MLTCIHGAWQPARRASPAPATNLSIHLDNLRHASQTRAGSALGRPCPPLPYVTQLGAIWHYRLCLGSVYRRPCRSGMHPEARTEPPGGGAVRDIRRTRTRTTRPLATRGHDLGSTATCRAEIRRRTPPDRTNHHRRSATTTIPATRWPDKPTDQDTPRAAHERMHRAAPEPKRAVPARERNLHPTSGSSTHAASLIGRRHTRYASVYAPRERERHPALEPPGDAGDGGSCTRHPDVPEATNDPRGAYRAMGSRACT